MRRARTALFAAVALAAAALFAAVSPARAQTAPPPDAPSAPVTITVLPTGAGPFRVTVLFPNRVDRARGKAELDTLVTLSGWQAAGLEWADTPAEGRFPAQTSAAFLVDSMYPNGALPVEAIAVAFRSWAAINALFAHGGALQYQGKPRYEDENAAVDVTAEPNALTIHYEIRNPNLEALPPMPRFAPGTVADAPEVQRGAPPGGWIFIAILGAGLAWLLVYAVVSGASRATRTDGTPPRRGR